MEEPRKLRDNLNGGSNYLYVKVIVNKHGLCQCAIKPKGVRLEIEHEKKTFDEETGKREKFNFVLEPDSSCYSLYPEKEGFIVKKIDSKMLNYSIETLEIERGKEIASKRAIDRLMNESPCKEFADASEERKIKIRDLDNVLCLLKEVKE